VEGGGGIKKCLWAQLLGLGMKEKLKDDECERGKYAGENLDDQDSIFGFEGGNGGIPVWTV
jgi:hypothetical protein